MVKTTVTICVWSFFPMLETTCIIRDKDSDTYNLLTDIQSIEFISPTFFELRDLAPILRRHKNLWRSRPSLKLIIEEEQKHDN